MIINNPIYIEGTSSHVDNRGAIWTTYSIVEDNISVNHVKISTNKRHVFRGFHTDEHTTKIATCIRGEIIAFVIDPLNTEYWEFKLDEINKGRLFIPPNFYNGFLAVKDSIYLYHLSYEGKYNDVECQKTLTLEESCLKEEVIRRHTNGNPLMRSTRDIP